MAFVSYFRLKFVSQCLTVFSTLSSCLVYRSSIDFLVASFSPQVAELSWNRWKLFPGCFARGLFLLLLLHCPAPGPETYSFCPGRAEVSWLLCLSFLQKETDCSRLLVHSRQCCETNHKEFKNVLMTG